MAPNNLPQKPALSNSNQEWRDRLIALTTPISQYCAALRTPEQLTASELITLEGQVQNALTEFNRAIVSPKTEDLWFEVFGREAYHAAATAIWGEVYQL
ncbi:MAG: hypothetical protein HC875_40370 [Anaerolineales bacterium]|nr:hypothetical protein [Anaerolineales bacterium]